MSPCNESEMASTDNDNRISILPRHVRPWCLRSVAAPHEKKADVEEHPGVFLHVGLLVNVPPGPDSIGQVALYVGIRRTQRKRGATSTIHLPPLSNFIKRNLENKEIVIFDGSPFGSPPLAGTAC